MDHDTVDRPGTPSLLRAINDRTALRLLADRGPLSRTRLGALAGLSKPTASQLMDRLEAAGLVEPVLDVPPAGVDADAAFPATPGRTARLYRLRGDAAYVAGLDVTPARIVARICDLTGRIVGEATLPTPGRSAAGTVDRVRQALTGASAVAGLDVAALHHVVIGLGGAFDPTTGRIGFARHLPGWHEPDLLDRLRAELTAPGTANPRVDVENDVNLAAVAEQAVGVAARPLPPADFLPDQAPPRMVRDFVVLWIAEGIGAAVVIDGRLHRGATGGAGEVGYMPVPGAPVVRTIGRGTNGGFQTLAGAPAVLKLARQHGFTGTDAPSAIARAVAAAIRPSGPPAVREAADRMLRELADRLATGLAPLVAVLDPELIVLTGAVLQAGHAPLRDLIADALQGMVIPRPRLVVSALADNPVLTGAIHAALAATREAVFNRFEP